MSRMPRLALRWTAIVALILARQNHFSRLAPAAAARMPPRFSRIGHSRQINPRKPDIPRT